MKTLLLLLCLLIASSLNATETQQSAKSAQLLQQAAKYPYLFRQGDFTVAPQAVALLEEATRLDANNAEAWTALGVAYQLQLSVAVQGGGKPDALLAAVQRVRGAYARAVQLDPEHASALGGHGSMLAVLAGLQREPQLFAQGLAEMNRAVQLQPAAVRPRLLRAFTSVNLPPHVRDMQAIESDVRFLIQVAGRSRPAAMLHVLLGDVHAELGHKDLARSEYQAAREGFAPLTVLADARLAALQQAGVRAADISDLRAGLSTRCTVCHAP